MLKSFSAQTNALGALNYKGTWDATANTPTLTSSVGTKGDYYVVSVAGSTALNGISNWGIGDWAVFNGSVWQRVEGGADVNAVNLTASGTSVLSGKVTAQTLTIGLGGQTAVATNTALGFEALNSASLTGTQSVAVGLEALKLQTTATFNTACGAYALTSATTGGSNTAIGRDSLGNLVSGPSNSAFGTGAGNVLTNGERNTIIGAASNASASNSIDQTVVGQGLTGKGDDTAFIGGTNGAYNEKNVITWEITSDQRIKKNIVSNNVGLEVISQIDVRNFEYRTAEEITDLPASAAINQSGVQLGVIAQELQAVLPECVTENSTGVLSVNTDQLIWYLVNSVKQLNAEIQTLKGV